MGWKQDKTFNLKNMGTKAGYCMQNVRLAFGIAPKYVDAKAAMLANKNAGTLHPISTLPKNVAVPVFIDTPSVNEHVEVADCGTFYSDGKKVSNPYSQRFFGWGETLNGVRIVSFVEDPKPAPAPAPKPADDSFKVGDVVQPIKLVDYNGTALKQYDKAYSIVQISGNRAVLAASRNGKMVVWAAMNINNIRRV